MRIQIVPPSSGSTIDRLAVGVAKLSVVVNDPLVAWMVLAELPKIVVAAAVLPRVSVPKGALIVPSKPENVAWIAPIVTVPDVVSTLKI